MATVYSYVRFSTKKQLEGDSLRRQVERGDEWIRKNKHTPASLRLHDIGVSAYRGKNRHAGALAKFLEAIKSGRVLPGSILLVENLDRLSRQAMAEAKRVFEQILESDVCIAVLLPTEAVYTRESISDPMGLMVPLMAFHLGHLESAKKSERLKALWDRKRKDAESGVKFSRRCPSWLKWHSDKFVIIPSAAAVVRYIFERTALGIGQRQLLAELVEKFSPIGTSEKWNASFIAHILNDPAVLGIRQPKTADADGNRVAIGKAIKGYYPAVITEELWHRAQSVKSKKRKMKGASSGFVNLFVGLLHNAHDGHPMHLQTSPYTSGKKQRRLISYGHIRKISDSDPITLGYLEFETAILRHLGELRPEDLESKGSVSALRAKEQELSGYEARLSQIETAMADPASDDFTSLRASAKIVRQKIDELKAEAEKLRAELHADQPLRHAHGVLKMLAEADDEQRKTLRLRLRSLIAELVKSIIIKPEKHYGRVYVLAQIEYHTGLFRQVAITPHGGGGHIQQVNVDEFAIDLRDRKKCQTRQIFAGLAKLMAQPGAVPTVEKVKPATTVGDAAILFLRVRRSQLAKESFRMIPSKVQKFIDFVGADLPCKNVNSVRWARWDEWLKMQIRGRKLATSTARICRDRAREFCKWLADVGACHEVKGAIDDASTTVIG